MVGGKKSSRAKDTVTREYTINLHKRLHDKTFKKRAPFAVKEIRKFAKKMMHTNDVRLDVKLNKVVWSRVGFANGADRRQPLHVHIYVDCIAACCGAAATFCKSTGGGRAPLSSSSSSAAAAAHWRPQLEAAS